MQSLEELLGQKKPEFIVIKKKNNGLAIINLNDFSLLQISENKNIQKKMYYNIAITKDDVILPAGKGFVANLILKHLDGGENGPNRR